MNDDVIVYVNSSHESGRYLREAARSAGSFRRFLPDAKYVLITDGDRDLPGFDEILLGDFRIPAALSNTEHKNGQMVAKLSALPRIEGDRFLYLGSDTYALSPAAGSIFAVLDRFDIAASHAPVRINTWRGRSHVPDVPAAFPEFNCDVVLWRRSPAVDQMLGQWRDLYLENAFGHRHDQGAFRWLVYHNDIRLAVLPPEYNYRGAQLRSDTVILQNREALDFYLAGGDALALPAVGRAVNQVLGRFGVSMKLVRAAAFGRG